MRDNSVSIVVAALMLCVVALGWLSAESTRFAERGIANAEFMSQHYKMDVPPELAKHYSIVITTTDVNFSGSQITNFFTEEDNSK